MGGIASNDAELEAILAPAVIEGLLIMAEGDLEPLIENVINGATHRGNFYSAGGAGSLSQAWTSEGYVGAGAGMGQIETHYDPRKITHDSGRGQHITPDNAWMDRQSLPNDPEAIYDMATLIDKGLGGMLFGPDNPTRQPTMFWSEVISQFQSRADGMIRKGLIAAGLPLV